MLFSFESILANASKGLTVTAVLLLVAILMMCLLLDEYLATLLHIASAAVRPREWHQLEGSRDFTSSRNRLAVLCTFPMALMVFKMGICTGDVMNSLPSHFQVAVIWGALMGYIALRWCVLSVIGWTIGSTDALRMMFFNSLSIIIMALPLMALALVFVLLSGGLSPVAVRWIAISACIIPGAVYLLKNRGFFIAEFSLFFWILYLCSLEVLPLAVVFKIVMNL